MSVNLNEVSKPLAGAFTVAGTAAAALLADPNFLSVVPSWVKPILVAVVFLGTYATIYFTPQAATPAQIQKAGSDAARTIAVAVTAPVATAVTAAVQTAVVEAASTLPQPVRDVVGSVSGTAGDLVNQILRSVR